MVPENTRRIVILTYGSRGDVEPFVALGVGLQNAGYAVRLAGPGPFAPLVEAHGLEFAPLEGNPDELGQAFVDRAGLSWPRMVVRMVQHVLPLAETVFRAVERAANDADLIVHSFLMTDAGHTLARLRGVPDVSAQFFPVFLSTSAFPAVALPDLPWGGAYRRATHALNTAMFRYGGRLLYRKVRASIPHLPDLAPWPFPGHAGGATPILFAYSPNVLAPSSDWPSYARVTGYWPLPPPTGWTAPEAILRFLESAPPPIYFGPGSMRGENLRNMLQLVVGSVRALGQRVFLGVAPQLLGGELSGPDLFAAEGIPHAWLFPRMRYILHHGGAGTTGAAATAGVPNTAIPFSADQAFWARRMYRLGLGPRAPAAHRLARNRLVRILEMALSDPAYQRRAEILGERIRREDGVASAVQVIRGELGPLDNGTQDDRQQPGPSAKQLGGGDSPARPEAKRSRRPGG
jgi:sterol 3beta-glucosyltransferase